MKILKKILLVFVVLIVVLVLIGFLLPRQFKIERSVIINTTPDMVFPLVNAPTNWPKWTVWNARDPNMKITFSGAGGGTGAKWAWESKTEGNGSMEFTEVDPLKRIAYKLSFPDMGMTSTGALTLVAADGKSTKVNWTNEGDYGMNPVFRYFGLFMDGIVGKDYEAGLVNLKALVEKQAAQAAAATAAPAAVDVAAPASAAPAPVEPVAATPTDGSKDAPKEAPKK